MENKGEIEEIETVKELEETNIKDKQKIKELEAEQNTIEDGKLVHEKKDKELIISKIIAEKNEFINTISTTENSLTDKIETEGENPERDKKIIEEQDRIHKISKESLQNNRKVDKSSIELVETASDNDESRSKTIRAETNEFMNEFSTREKYVIKILEIECENPERDKKIIKKQDKIKNKENDKENQEIFTTKELANNKKDKKVINSKIIVEKNDSLNKIPTTEKSLKFVGENPERDKKIIRKQDTIRDKITKEFPLDKNSVNQKFEWTNLKMIKNFHNTILERDNKKTRHLSQIPRYT